MKKLFVSSIVFCCAFHTYGTNYYFSAAGNNNNSGTSSSSPWLTLSKLTAITLQPGDDILLRRGDTFAGGVTINQSGNSSNPIVFEAYGTGANPIISGFTTVSSWTNLGGGIYESTSAISSLATMNMVTVNGIPYAMGRYPKITAANKGYVTFQSHSGGGSTGATTSITSDAISGFSSFVGGEVVVRSIRHTLDRGTITAQTSTTVTFKAGSYYVPLNNYGFFFQNHPVTLTQANTRLGEWYYNPSTRKLRMYFGTNSPASYTVKGSSSNVLVNVSRRAYIKFLNISFQGANTRLLKTEGTNHITVQNCELLYAGEDAIGGVTANNTTVANLIDNNLINWSNNNGLYFNLPDQTTATGKTNTGYIVRNNTIKNTGTFAGMGRSGDAKYAAIVIYGGGNTVQNNVITNTGWCGIYYMWGDNVLIKNNYIDRFCSVKNDGGGLYTYNNGKSPLTFTGQRITGNIFVNALHSNEGTPSGASSTSWSHGIYLDINVSGLEIDNNTIANVDRGIFNHNCYNLKIHHNTLYNNVKQIDMTYSQDATTFPVRNVTIKNNIFFSRTSTQSVAEYRTLANDIGSFGTFDSNYYCRPIFEPNGINSTSSSSGGVVKAVTGQYTGDQATKYYSLDTWKKTYTSYDVHSKKTSKTITDPSKIKFEYNATNKNRTITLNVSYIGVNNTVYSGTLTLLPYSSLILIGRDSILNVPPNVNITSPASNTQLNAPTIIAITATATDSDGSISKVEFYSGSKMLGSDNSSPYSYNWSNVASGNYTLTAKAYDNSGATTVSPPVAVVVSAQSISPTVSLTSPIANQTYGAPASIIISANAADQDGSISKVEFYNGNTLITTEKFLPYSWTWNSVPAGNYTITAKAYDNSGATKVSSPISVVVSAKNISTSSINGSPIDLEGEKKRDMANISIGPNPAHNTISIFNQGFVQNKDLKISILSINGILVKVINSSFLNSMNQIDISFLIAGTYLLKLMSGDKIVYKQFVKQ